jgi:putative CocE/NonD family hydrolase
MREVTGPHEVRCDDHVITVADGTRLSLRIWRPVTSDAEPVPAVLEAIPYRKRDLMSPRDSIHHPYLAGHGIAGVRLDLRGTGDSEGVLTDEYTETEHRDIEEILAWLAAQPWCTGRTGMMGLSWGGFNALQVAARRPPSLGAIVIASFTDDRYTDDMHYMGGCLLSDNLAEAGTMFAYATCPPDPEVVGDRWRDMWRERLEAAAPWAAEWLRHQRRDAYWRRASVCEDHAAVQVPVLAASGWADGYTNAVFRVLEHLDVPRRGLIGPWSHRYPHLGEPGPAIGYLQEVRRWFDHWLRDADTGVMDEPMLHVYLQDSVPPSTSYEQRPGRWVGEPSWPSPNVEPEVHPLAAHRIGRPGEEVAELELSVSSPLSVGQFAGKWASYNAPPDMPYDQREEDGGSLVFESDPLPDRREILGPPVVDLELSADRPIAMLAARVSDVAPDGPATRVTYGLLNLTHRDSNDAPQPLEPGRRYRVRLALNAAGQAFPPGHRVRLSLSSSYWPLAWPPPGLACLTVHSGSLTLPVRADGSSEDPDQGPSEEPEGAPRLSTTQVLPGEYRWELRRDLVGYESTLEIVKDVGVVRYDDIDLEVGRRAVEWYGSVANDFCSVSGVVEWTMTFARDDWRVRVVTRQALSCSETDFVLHAQLDAYEDERRVFARNWDETFARYHL